MLDQKAIFSDDQDLTGQGIGTAKSTNGYDFGLPGTDVQGNTAAHDPGLSELAVEARVTADFTSAGAATVQFVLCTYTDAARTANRKIIQQTDAIAKATLVKGYRAYLGKLPPNISQEFASVEYVVAVAALTAGKVRAYFGPSTYP